MAETLFDIDIFDGNDGGPVEHVPPGPLSDLDRAFAMFEALGIGSISDRMVYTMIPGVPWSKARPRFTKTGRTYVPDDDRKAEERTAGALRNAVRGQRFEGNVALGCVFFRPTMHRIDADNMLKHVCDSATGVVWADDSQCTAVMAMVELDRDNPRTLIVLGEHWSSMGRGINSYVDCLTCGRPVPPNKTHRKTCSKQCARIAMNRPRDPEMVTCRVCEQPFLPAQKRVLVCSEVCRKAHLAAVSRQWRASHPKGGAR